MESSLALVAVRVKNTIDGGGGVCGQIHSKVRLTIELMETHKLNCVVPHQSGGGGRGGRIGTLEGCRGVVGIICIGECGWPPTKHLFVCLFAYSWSLAGVVSVAGALRGVRMRRIELKIMIRS